MRKNIINYLNKENVNIKDKRVLVIGGNGTLGQALCGILEYLEVKLYKTSRNPQNELYLDFFNQEALASSIAKLKDINPDYIFINSGIDNGTEENIYQVNCLGPIEIIKEFPNSKIIIVGSISYKTKKKNDYYALSKRKLMLEAKNYSNASIVHPGIVKSPLFDKRNNKGIKMILLFFVKPFMNSPEKSCLCFIKGISNNDSNTWIGPKHFNAFGYPKKSKLKL